MITASVVKACKQEKVHMHAEMKLAYGFRNRNLEAFADKNNG